MQENSLSTMDVDRSTVINLRTRTRAYILFRLLGRYVCVLYHRLRPLCSNFLQSHHAPLESTPFSLLQECLLDMRTALYRIGRRIDKLPFPYLALFGSAEVGPTGNLQPSTRTLACMKDMQCFENRFPTATQFDRELFLIGWEAGARYSDGSVCKTQPEKTYTSPNSKI
jgi:hypothetical protein